MNIIYGYEPALPARSGNTISLRLGGKRVILHQAEALQRADNAHTIASLMQQLIGTVNSPYARHCAKALAEIGGEDVREVLIAIVETRELHENVRDAAYYGLGLLADARVIPVLVAGIEDESEFIQSGALMAFWQIRTPEAVRVLAGSLGKSGWIDQHVIAALKVNGTAEALSVVAEWEASQGERDL
jgi:HEAT repeat protein